MKIRAPAFTFIKGTPSHFALSCPADVILFHGTRGSSKTASQLMSFLKHVGKGYKQYWKGILIDKEYKDFADVIAQSKRFFKAHCPKAKFLESASQLKWVFPEGEELLFRHMKKESDYEGIHGHEYPWNGFNELTKQPTPALFDKVFSTNRSSFIPELHTPRKKDGSYDTANGKVLPPIPLISFNTTNPNGAGHNWVKRRFINAGKNKQLVETKVKVFNPKTKQEEIVIKRQVAIFGSYKDNPFLDVKYIAELDRLTSNNINLRKAWLEGSWDIVSGGAIDDLWNSEIHILPTFRIPKTWRVDRSFDWGSSHPFAVGWFAESNGEEAFIEWQGKEYRFCPPPGTLILLSELYGTESVGTNRGVKWSAKRIAQEIKYRESQLINSGVVSGKIYPGTADNQIYDVREKDVDTIAKKMEDEGVYWLRSDKSPGSRKIGLELLRTRLEASLSNEGAGFYITQNCINSIDTIPVLPRSEKNPEDVDTSAEDHLYDMVRYRVLKSSNRVATNFKTSFV